MIIWLSLIGSRAGTKKKKCRNWKSLTWSSSDRCGPIPAQGGVWLPRLITIGLVGQSSAVIYGVAIVCVRKVLEGRRVSEQVYCRISSGKETTVWAKNSLFLSPSVCLSGGGSL